MEPLRESAARAAGSFLQELRGIDDGVKIVLQTGETPEKRALTAEDAARLLDFLHALPHGVMSVNASLGGPVATSTNLAVCKSAGPRIDILTSQRSIFASSMLDVSEMVASIGRMAGAEAEKLHDYPAWSPDMDSKILKTSRQVYTDLFGEAPRAEVIHAGLECAVFAERMPGLDMISLGPTVEQAHSPSERVLIPTVERMWVLLTALLKRLAEEPAA
jgi:dipeptidase D